MVPYYVQLLVNTIRDLSPLPYTSQNPESQGTAYQKKPDEADTMRADDDDRTHRLSLMLISTISSLPMTIMLRALDEIYIIINAYSYSSSSSPRDKKSSVVDDGNKEEEEGSQSDSERKRRRRKKKELLEALFSEILEKIGDCKKAAAMKWWYTYRPILISDLESGGYVDQGKVGKKYVSVDDVAGEKNQMSSSNSSILSRL